MFIPLLLKRSPKGGRGGSSSGRGGSSGSSGSGGGRGGRGSSGSSSSSAHSVPLPKAVSGRSSATAYGEGSKQVSTIPQGQLFAGRTEGGGLHEEIYGTRYVSARLSSKRAIDLCFTSILRAERTEVGILASSLLRAVCTITTSPTITGLSSGGAGLTPSLRICTIRQRYVPDYPRQASFSCGFRFCSTAIQQIVPGREAH